MKKYLIALLLVCSSYLSAASWMTIPGTIPLGGSHGAVQDVHMAYYPKLKKVVAAWVNIHDTLPYYSTYNGTSWTAGKLFESNTFTAETNINLQSFPKLQIIVAAWGGNVSQQSYYSIFDGTGWTPANTIELPLTHPVLEEIKMTYDKTNNRIIAAWNDSSTLQPVYAVLSGSTIPALTWSAVDFISTIPGIHVNNNVNLIYNKIDQTVVATWGNEESVPPYTRAPVYSTFNVLSSPSFPIAWTTPTAINVPHPANNVFDDIQLVTAPGTPDVFAFWASFNPLAPIPIPQTPFSAFYNGTSFGNGDPFPGRTMVICTTETPAGVLDNISSENIDTLALFSAWGCQESATPVYTIVTLPSTIVGGSIPQAPSVGVMANVNLKYDQKSGQMIAAWVDSGTNALYFNIYQ